MPSRKWFVAIMLLLGLATSVAKADCFTNPNGRPNIGRIGCEVDANGQWVPYGSSKSGQPGSGADMKWSDLFKAHSVSGGVSDCKSIPPVKPCTDKDGRDAACPADSYWLAGAQPYVNIAKASGLKYGCWPGSIDAFVTDFRETACARLGGCSLASETLARMQALQESLGLPLSLRLRREDCNGAVQQRHAYHLNTDKGKLECASEGRARSLALIPGATKALCNMGAYAKGRTCDVLVVYVHGKSKTIQAPEGDDKSGPALIMEAAGFLAGCDNRLAEQALRAVGTKARVPWSKSDLELVRDRCLTAAALYMTDDVHDWATAVAAAFDQAIAGKLDPSAPPIPFVRTATDSAVR